MDISKINSNSIDNTLSNAKNKAADSDFEKHLNNAVEKNDDKELKKVCQDFEGIILKMLYKQMKATVPKAELIPEDMGTDIFNSMLDDKLMEEASKSSKPGGLADILYKQLSKQQKLTDKIESESDDTSGVGKK